MLPSLPSMCGNRRMHRLLAGAIPDMIEASLHGVSQIFVANHAGTGEWLPVAV